ncbi:phosphoribosylamine--glycine ligase [Naumannella halotolerans]|uniref:Phosphoribosylamine--glycine ligase n=1 Tax=Naumannella halotolerans TaxID=993414 RepID=A0A4R7JBY2_9ACTN|nr:phosphoribosylamine--glycine ligase [Naumannella halotolerans]TDT34516.1 phosphoribosylamine--glycine ligase [Naumannella halotolerans]
MTESDQLPRTVLVVGSGGREHALATAIARDPAVQQVHCAPGNPGTALFATNHPLDIDDGAAVAALARELAVDLVVIGPEAPLVDGVADRVRAAGIPVFGPDAAAARLEGSKAFAKEVMAAAGIPTAAARVCTTIEQTAAALDGFGAPYVVKDDGLAAGKGVVVTDDRDAALAHAQACGQVVIEEYLDGPEVSLFAVTDGTTVLPLQPAQDFKRAYDDDQGPNTGGMGAYTPLDWAPDGLVDETVRTVIQPAVDELRRRGTPFVGLVYAGLALTSKGLRVVEFNARFGDPETQPLLSLLRSPLGQVLYAAATGTLADQPPLVFADGYAVGVVLAAEGYPEAPVKGGVIDGLAQVLVEQPGRVFLAGVGTADGELVASGGRVFAVTGSGPDLDSARTEAYTLLSRLDLPGGFHRTDIAARAAAGELTID